MTATATTNTNTKKLPPAPANVRDVLPKNILAPLSYLWFSYATSEGVHYVQCPKDCFGSYLVIEPNCPPVAGFYTATFHDGSESAVVFVSDIAREHIPSHLADLWPVVPAAIWCWNPRGEAAYDFLAKVADRTLRAQGY